VRNVFNPTHPGTVIEGRACSLTTMSQAWQEEMVDAKKSWRKAACPVQMTDESPIKGITSVDNVALLNIEGTMTCVPDLAPRLFDTLARIGVQVVMTTQASADSSICVVVEEAEAERAIDSLNQAFDRELSRGLVGGITAELGHSVVAIVGEGMAFRAGIGATFTKAMANTGVNIRAIAQGSSERQISICVEKDDCTKALRAAHAALALSNTQLDVAIIGASGAVGTELIRQLVASQRVIGDPRAAAKRQVLNDLQLDFKVTAVARSSVMRKSYDGIDVEHGLGLEEGAEGIEPTDLEQLTRFLSEGYNGNRVVIDCSISRDVADMYPVWLSRGINVISANKKGGSGSLEHYDQCLASRGSQAQWFYETTGPGSGLPVLSILQDMKQSGDSVFRVEGVFSGTISFLIYSVTKGVPLSLALEQAAALSLCEPDPRDDLTGLDVRQKVVVLARELGLRLSSEDVDCESLLPEALADWAPDESEGAPTIIEQLVEALRPYDGVLSKRIAEMRANGMVAVHLGCVDVASGTASVKLTPLPATSLLARCEDNENVVAITSQRYSPRPMVLQGPGAGAGITAQGLFADLLHLSRTLVEWSIPKIQ